MIPDPGQASGTYLFPVRDRIIELLRSSKVLRSRAWTFEVPSHLTYVPGVFRDRGGIPLFGSECDRAATLCDGYRISELAPLGVAIMNASMFLRKLEAFIEREPHNFRNKPAAWHSRLADAIRQHWNVCRESARLLPLIPLRDRVWVHSLQGNLFFPGTDSGLQVPEGISVHILDLEASRDPSRCQLFADLGVQTLDRSRVCELIFAQHAGLKRSQTRNWTKDTMVSHASYLFHASHFCKLPSLRNLQICVRDSKYVDSGFKLYLDVPGCSNPVSSYFRKAPTTIKLIDASYLQENQGAQYNHWIHWLQSALEIYGIPRLVNAEHQMTTEFKYLIRNEPSTVFLTLLRDHWNNYSRNFVMSIYWGRSRIPINSPSNVQSELSRAPVRCLGGYERSLNQTVLPLPRLLDQEGAREAVDFLDIGDVDATDNRWLNFYHLGVVVEESLVFYVRILQGLFRRKVPNVTLHQVLGLYTQIQNRYHENPSLVRYLRQDSILVSLLRMLT